MSGGCIVVLDRAGRGVKQFPLAAGLATIGSAPGCDIRIMLSTVCAHHASIVVHPNQTVVRNVGEGETYVNDVRVSVAALQHGDVIRAGGRALRWEYSEPQLRRPAKAEPALVPAGRGRAGSSRRATGVCAPAALARSPAVRLALEMTHRSSTPGSSGAKQVAIVQPQRRDTNDQNDTHPPRSPSTSGSKRPRASKSDCDTAPEATPSPSGSSSGSTPPATKASLWIDSRKTSPRKSVKMHTQPQPVPGRRSVPSREARAPLRLAVLRRAAEPARRPRRSLPAKIQAPLTIDHTKQAAILLMTGHTPKSRLTPKSANSPSFIVKKPSPVRKTPAGRGGRPSRSKETKSIGVTPKRASSFATTTRRSSRKSPGDQTASVLEITDPAPSARGSSRRSRLSNKSPLLPSPKKSALKDPKKSMRKNESIKFDLSNLDNYSQDSEDILMADMTKQTQNASDDNITLRYSDSPNTLSPSPRRSIHSRSSRILEKSLGTSVTLSPSRTRTLTPESPRSRQSARGSLILQKALDNTQYSSRSSRAADATQNTDAFRTRTLSPRSPRNNLESYSIVDLVSIDSNESGRSASVYNSADSSTTTFGTPQNSAGRKTRSTIDPTLLLSSTPYVKAGKMSTRSRITLDSTNKTLNDVSLSTTRGSTRRSKSLTNTDTSQLSAKNATRRTQSLSTPENSEDTKKHISLNSTKISRVSKSRSRINDSDLLLVDKDNDSPKSSRRASRAKSSKGSPAVSTRNSSRLTSVNSPSQNDGTITPDHVHSPEEATTPVLSIQSLLDSSQSSMVSNGSLQKGRRFASSYLAQRNTIGGISARKTRADPQSMSFTARKTRLRLSSDSVEEINRDDSIDDEAVTPKSGVKLVQEAVKNKHSTAKKPQSKRSIIDDLNESDIVKQLFNSPVKRKLSQSMTEFSRKQLFDDDDFELVKRPTRNTIALTGRTPENFILINNSESFTPDRFVSPINTPANSPNLTGIKRLFARNTPKNDLRNIKAVKGLLRTPRTRKSIKNDLTNVAGVKAMFAKSPANRLSDVRLKEVFAASPRNDLRRVTGVKSLFHAEKTDKSPKNDLTDVRGVKKLFKRKSPKNDLGNISGVKKTMRKSPRNDLTDVRGVRRMFRGQKDQNNGLSDISGVEELFNTSSHSHRDAESLFDQLVGKPQIRAVYSKTFTSKQAPKKKTRRRKSISFTLDSITNNVEEWLEQELQKRLQKKNEASSSKNDSSKLTREMQKLATDTVEGTTPLRNSRVRNSTVSKSIETELKRSASDIYSAHTLPIKKRSLVDKSLDKTEVSKTKAINLPIKKRVVVHSTPVKGRVNMTMNASELSRVSPITVVDKTAHGHDTTVGTTQAEDTVKPTRRRQAKAKIIEVIPELEKPSPKKTRQRLKVATPAKTKPISPKAKRGRAAKGKEASPKKSLVQTKQETPKARTTRNKKGKSDDENKVVNPVQAPAKTKARKAASPAKPTPSPAKARTTRSRKSVTLETNVKKRRASLVVSKRAPVMSPKPKATRKNAPIEPKVTPKVTRGRKVVNIVEKVNTPKVTRAKAQKVVLKPSPVPPKPTRGRKTDNQIESPKSKARGNAQTEVATKTRGKKANAKQDSQENTEAKPKRGRKTADNTTGPEIGPKRQTRAKQIETQESVQSEPSGQRLRTTKADQTAPIRNSRKRKTTAVEEIPPKIAKSETRGRKASVTEPSNVRKGGLKKDGGSGDAGNKSQRGKKPAESQVPKESPKTTRGRKKTNAAETATGKRKRKPSPEPSPVKEAGGKKTRAGARASPAQRTRASATNQAPAGRSRRR